MSDSPDKSKRMVLMLSRFFVPKSMEFLMKMLVMLNKSHKVQESQRSQAAGLGYDLVEAEHDLRGALSDLKGDEDLAGLARQLLEKTLEGGKVEKTFVFDHVGFHRVIEGSVEFLSL